MPNKICPNCGTQLPEEARFCFKCGAKLPDEESALKETGRKVVVCEICGFENSADSRYCISCGSLLSGELIESEQSQKVELEIKESKTSKEAQKPEIKSEKKKKRARKLKISFNQVFYLGLAIVFVGLISYGLIKKEKSKPDVHQHPEVNQEIMAEIERLRERVNSNPDDLASTLRLANLLHDVHIFDQAVMYYRKYLERNEKDPDARVDMGICLFELGKVNEAIAEIEKALSYAPNHQLALYNLGVVNLASGNVEKAREYFQRCIDVNPDAEVAQKAKRMLEQHKF